MTQTVFVDETKQRRYLMAACFVESRELAAAGSALRSLVLPGKQRLHMSKESESRRRLILSAIQRCQVQTRIYISDDGGHKAARAACLTAIVGDAAMARARRMVLDRDETLVGFDDRTLIEATRRYGCRDVLGWEHRAGSSESLLALPDAVAWAWARGGDWRRRAGPAIAVVRHV